MLKENQKVKNKNGRRPRTKWFLWRSCCSEMPLFSREHNVKLGNCISLLFSVSVLLLNKFPPLIVWPFFKKLLLWSIIYAAWFAGFSVELQNIFFFLHILKLLFYSYLYIFKRTLFKMTTCKNKWHHHLNNVYYQALNGMWWILSSLDKIKDLPYMWLF